jgi:Bacterial Ig domain
MMTRDLYLATRGAWTAKLTRSSTPSSLSTRHRMQIPVTSDSPPAARPDVYVVPLEGQSSLHVLSNDSVAFGSLSVIGVTDSTNSVCSPCVNASCIVYTPRFRFAGFDQITYTAVDARGRVTNTTVSVRIVTTPPRLTTVPAKLNNAQNSRVQPFISSQLSYEDPAWRLSAAVTLRLSSFAPPASSWPNNAISLLSSAAETVSSAQAADASSLSLVNASSIEATMSGNVSALQAQLSRLTVLAPQTYSGPSLLSLAVCSEWQECQVRAAHRAIRRP